MITCATCNKALKPVVFKGHLATCAQPTKSKQELGLRVEQITEKGVITCAVSYCGLTWQTDFSDKQLLGVLTNLQLKSPNCSLFKTRSSFMQVWAKVEDLEDDMDRMRHVQVLLEQVSQFESLRQDSEFRRMLKVQEKLEQPLSYFKQAGLM